MTDEHGNGKYKEHRNRKYDGSSTMAPCSIGDGLDGFADDEGEWVPSLHRRVRSRRFLSVLDEPLDRMVDRVVRWMNIPVIGPLLGILLLPFLLIYLAVPLIAFLAFGVVMTIFWTVPSVVWLSGFRGISVVDAASWALGAADGQPQYNLAFGMNNDPATIGFFLFNLLAWGAALGAVALVGLPFYLVWKKRERMRFVREWNESHPDLPF
jgi:hypothetical protein